MLRLLVSPKWITWHVLTLGAMVTCGFLSVWQWHRAGSAMGSALNVGYGVQWPIFAVFFGFMWWHFLRMELRALRSPADATGAGPGAGRTGEVPSPRGEAVAPENRSPGARTPRTDPAGAEPAATEPAGTAPTGTAPMGTAPMGAAPMETERADPGPADTGPASVEPADIGPMDTDAADRGPAESRPVGAGPAGRAGAVPDGPSPFTPRPRGVGPSRLSDPQIRAYNDALAELAARDQET